MFMTLRGRFHPGRPLLFAVALLTFTSSVACTDTPEKHIERGDKYRAEGKQREAIIEYLNAIKLDADNRPATLRLGPMLFDAGQVGPAFRYLQKGVEFEPDNVELRVRLATIYYYGGGTEQAREEASAVLDRDAKNLDALTIFANTASTEGEIDGAITRLENARAENEAKAKYHLAMGVLYLRKQDSKTAETYFQEAAKREPDSPEAHLALGTFYLATRQPATAKEEFDKAAQVAPARSMAQIRVVDLYRAMGQPDEGDRHLDEIVKEAPDFFPAWRRIAQYAFADKNFDRCQEALTHILEANAKDPDSLRMMGEVHLAKGETEEAQKNFREAITVLQDVVNRRPDVASLHFQLAQLHVRVGETTQARNQLQTVVQLAPNSPSAIMMLAELNINSGDPKSAQAPLTDLIKRQPSAVAYDLLGRAYYQDKDFARASAAFAKFAELAPREPRAHQSLGSSLAAENKIQEAVPHLEEALRLDPKYLEPLAVLAAIDARQQKLGAALARVERQIAMIEPSARHQVLLGQLYSASNQLDNAEKAFRKATEIDPEMSIAYGALTGLLVRSGRANDALVDLDKGLAQNPKNVPVLVLKGMLQQQQGSVDDAQKTYEQVLQINAKSAVAANNLAYIYQEQGNLEEALRLAEVAREQAPDNPDIADTLGWILYKRGTYDRALGLLKESAAKKPDNADILFHLGFTHNKLGQFTETAQVLKQAIGLAPKNAMASEAQAILAELH
jgi:tetratricopeptide (TPR) repeat protein